MDDAARLFHDLARYLHGGVDPTLEFHAQPAAPIRGGQRWTVWQQQRGPSLQRPGDACADHVCPVAHEIVDGSLQGPDAAGRFAIRFS